MSRPSVGLTNLLLSKIDVYQKIFSAFLAELQAFYIADCNISGDTSNSLAVVAWNSKRANLPFIWFFFLVDFSANQISQQIWEF